VPSPSAQIGIAMSGRLELVTAATVALLPTLLSAQTIRGTVVDRSDVPVHGVVVLLLDSASSIVSRDLSDESGAFRVVGPRSGHYRLRTLRIGFQPVTSEAVRMLEGQERTQRVVLTGLPFQLDPTRVGRSSCDVRSDSTAASFAIWEQARTALTAAQLTSRTRAIGARVVSYERVVDLIRRGRVVRQSSRILSGLTTRPWRSLSADSLRRIGYVVQELESVTYYVPDIDVLLSDTFAEDHCFQPASSRNERIIGVAFEPARERRAIPEIKGVLWLDRKTAELQRLEFRYVNVPREQQTGDAGGEVEFARMKNGAWVITRWNTRMPLFRVRYVAATGLRSDARVAELIVEELRVEGADLALVTRGRDTLWSRPPVVVSGTVLDSISGRGLADADVLLRGTAVRAKADAAGRFQLRDVLPGEYTVDISTPSLSALGAVHSFQHTFLGTADALEVRVPTAELVAVRMCGASIGGVVAGRVRMRGDSVPPRGTRVVAEWIDPTVGDTAARKRQRWADAIVDARGAYRVCGIPRNTAIALRVESDSGTAPTANVRLAQGQQLTTHDVLLDPSMKGAAVLSGLVLTDVNGRPVADAEVALPSLRQNVFTDSAGRFRISGIPEGTHVVAVRRVGFKPSDVPISFAPNQRIERSLLLSSVQTLDTVQVEARSAIASFDENRKRGLGKFITRAELEKQEGRQMAEVLAQLPGVEIHYTNRIAAVTSSRRGRVTYRQVDPENPRSTMQVRAFCYPQVYLDHSLVYRGEPTEPPFDINSLLPSNIEAVEFYGSTAQAPSRYSTGVATCGVLVIHLRRGK
jgi:hypothetical protein